MQLTTLNNFYNIVALNTLDYCTLGYYKLLYIQKCEVVLYIGELKGEPLLESYVGSKSLYLGNIKNINIFCEGQPKCKKKHWTLGCTSNLLIWIANRYSQ